MVAQQQAPTLSYRVLTKTADFVRLELHLAVTGGAGMGFWEKQIFCDRIFVKPLPTRAAFKHPLSHIT